MHVSGTVEVLSGKAGVSGFGIGAFGGLSAGCSKLRNLVARVQATSYVACYGSGLHAFSSSKELRGLSASAQVHV